MKKILLYSAFLICGYLCKAQTVTDADGNVYHTVTIGTQTWMVENLRTRKYNDGDTIPNITNATAWAELTTPAYCWYNNDSSTSKTTYGALYNWYAVNTGKIAPKGWHVPTDAEWDILVKYLVANGYNYNGTTDTTGYNDKNRIAKALASTTGWSSFSNTGAVGNTDYPAKRNSTGFTALPGGYRDNCGGFLGVGDGGNWWGSYEDGAYHAWYRYIYSNTSYVSRSSCNKDYGASVRCVKDAIVNSINEKSLYNEMNLYPNPTNGILYFRNNNNSNLVTIYDSQGKILTSKKFVNNIIDITEYQNGIYMIKIIDSDRITINRVIKQ
jgi:uncharacterized protein (TIGR02145 family)